MKKLIFAIFAHPDDEAFGTAGALLKETRSGTELHLILLTAGDAGANPDNAENLSDVRLKEWKQSTELLGATSTHFLGYKDGQLNNLAMIEATERIEQIVKSTLENSPSGCTVEFMSLDLNGLSGHIDHIVAARATCLVFYRLKRSDARLARIRFACVPNELFPDYNVDWLYREKGRAENEVDEVVDARDLKDDIIAIMRVHTSQRSDFEFYAKLHGDRLGIYHFLVKT